MNDLPLIQYTASKGKPMIISTGVATTTDIESALRICREAGNDDITLLKCTSQYPATISDANLATIPDMRDRYNVRVGLSDHTMGHLVPVVGVPLGAEVVEKHFILDRSMGGPDSAFSMTPDEFSQMVRDYWLTLDYSEDMKMFEELFAHIDSEKPCISTTEIFFVLDNNSWIAKLNQVMELRYVSDKNLIVTLNEKTRISIDL